MELIKSEEFENSSIKKDDTADNIPKINDELVNLWLSIYRNEFSPFIEHIKEVVVKGDKAKELDLNHVFVTLLEFFGMWKGFTESVLTEPVFPESKVVKHILIDEYSEPITKMYKLIKKSTVKYRSCRRYINDLKMEKCELLNLDKY